MGSPEKLYPPGKVRRLTKSQKDRLKRRIEQVIRKDPAIAAVISAHRKVSALIRKRVGKG
jgi:hypothetical protein